MGLIYVFIVDNDAHDIFFRKSQVGNFLVVNLHDGVKRVLSRKNQFGFGNVGMVVLYEFSRKRGI